ncbi:hypothetical protein AB4072_08425 [Microvirga sp. 2MCAF38]|uniref:hypothetical protein n=1 Tax=Microvirga sp. 2MCAF38 TaxID=3232989 RepID=UPI003F9902D0
MARDYKAEYQRRIQRGAARGLSRSQARGHARAHEPAMRTGSKPDERFERALKSLRLTNNQSWSARSAGISVERFRRFLRENNLAQRDGRSWKLTDDRLREITMITNGKIRPLRVFGYETASLIGQYGNAVGNFLRTNDVNFLEPFKGRSIHDASGVEHIFETNPNTLYRLVHAGGETFEVIYRLIS